MSSDQELKSELLLIVHNIWRKQPHLCSKALFLIEEKTK